MAVYVGENSRGKVQNVVADSSAEGVGNQLRLTIKEGELVLGKGRDTVEVPTPLPSWGEMTDLAFPLKRGLDNLSASQPNMGNRRFAGREAKKLMD